MPTNSHSVNVGVGAVLYDDRAADRRECCRQGGRCLWHVTELYEPVDGSDRLIELWCGTHTSRKYVIEPDLLDMFVPAGWSWPTGRKPTYHLTRTVKVHDNHDLMLEANRS